MICRRQQDGQGKTNGGIAIMGPLDFRGFDANGVGTEVKTAAIRITK